ncbi:hypothetical protein DLAC_07800 [Tieghemostelium lacteum]|uniref:Uncharacterized protein n=1 Tax=Tieghemostelium lacteum TaxID=361077 RepID=A0A151ZAF8_TIELA|nr:hypothetical protein DLAC_07800 [Tieghemostelium lacteum]|eukprot:KYQ90925.1 hypothetical protein DLAC_07800 [Tieghemostelium lacteum]
MFKIFTAISCSVLVGYQIFKIYKYNNNNNKNQLNQIKKEDSLKLQDLVAKRNCDGGEDGEALKAHYRVGSRPTNYKIKIFYGLNNLYLCAGVKAVSTSAALVNEEVNVNQMVLLGSEKGNEFQLAVRTLVNNIQMYMDSNVASRKYKLKLEDIQRSLNSLGAIYAVWAESEVLLAYLWFTATQSACYYYGSLYSAFNNHHFKDGVKLEKFDFEVQIYMNFCEIGEDFIDNFKFQEKPSQSMEKEHKRIVTGISNAFNNALKWSLVYNESNDLVERVKIVKKMGLSVLEEYLIESKIYSRRVQYWWFISRIEELYPYETREYIIFDGMKEFIDLVDNVIIDIEEGQYDIDTGLEEEDQSEIEKSYIDYLEDLLNSAEEFSSLLPNELIN